MKKFNTLVILFFFASFLSAQTLADFENLVLAPDTFWNGSDLSGSFTSGNARFVNDYNATWDSWSGFTYSNIKDSATAGFGNQYAAITASGYNGSLNYAVADEYGNAKVILTGSAVGKLVKGFYVTNTTYAYLSMRDGDMFSKKFGGTSGTDADWFKLTARGWAGGSLKNETVEFYLADFRSPDSTQDYILNNWAWVNLQPLGNVDSIIFQLTSSDTGQFGMNTPAYFAMDDFTTADALYTAPIAVDDYVTISYLKDTIINVLLNDTVFIATPLQIQIIGTPLIGGASAVVTGNQIYYTPAVGIVATDTIYYQLCDGANVCVDAKVIVRVTGITDVEELSASLLQLNPFPNPFTGNTINISVDENLIGYEITLYNLQGKLMSAGKITTSNYELSTADLAAGVYLLRVHYGATTLLRKIVKQ